jgi:hypothetical protein
LSYGVGDLGPEQVDVFVEAVEGEAAQRRIGFGEEAHEAGSGGDADRGHGGERDQVMGRWVKRVDGDAQQRPSGWDGDGWADAVAQGEDED